MCKIENYRACPVLTRPGTQPGSIRELIVYLFACPRMNICLCIRNFRMCSLLNFSSGSNLRDNVASGVSLTV